MTIKFAVIGTGFGTIVHIPAILDCPDAEVVAVCSAHEERSRETAKRFGIPKWSTDYREAIALPEVDAVAIATPAYLHHPMAMTAIEAGKHVLCEKPMALNAAECREMFQAAEAHGLTHMVCFEFRWTPARAYMKHLIDEGFIGPIRHINMSMHLPARGGSLASPYLNWAAQRKYGGGMLMALGSHYVDMFRWFMGEPSGVFGQLYTHGPEREGGVADADDAFVFTLRARSGAWASVTASMAAPFGTGSRIEVYGSTGALFHGYPSFNPSPRDTLWGARDGEEGTHQIAIPPEFFPFDDDRDVRMMPFRLMLAEFVKSVQSGKPVAPSFEDGLRVQEVMDGVFRASDGGCWVEL